MALVPPYIADLQPYVPGLSVEDVRRRFGVDRVIKLASNENPLGPSPLAVEALRRAATEVGRYPDGGRALCHKLASRFGVKPENVMAGPGSEGIMANIVRTFLADDDEVLTSEGTFSGIRVLTQSRGVRLRTVPLTPDWRYDLAAIGNAIGPRTKLIYLANPNNPTGTIFTRDEFHRFHRSLPDRVLVILDEAYFEFAQSDARYPDSMHYRYDNVITLRTFSKAYGLAGARVGYGFAHEDLIAMLAKVKLPFEPSHLASAAAMAALDDDAFLARTIEMNEAGKRQLLPALRELDLAPLDTHANFIMTRPENARETFDQMLRQGVILRALDAFGLPGCLRITIGTTEENERCLHALERLWRTQPV